jgi:hypothetical protein
MQPAVGWKNQFATVVGIIWCIIVHRCHHATHLITYF